MTAGRLTEYDVAVVGGGPAGATVATLIAQQGYRVVLLERSISTGFKIGESLMPATWRIFSRLGVLEQMKSSAFPRKHSVQFYSRTGRASAPFYFRDAVPSESSVTWQVLRSEFDELLLRNAVAKGVTLLRGVSVDQVQFEEQKAVGLRWFDERDTAYELRVPVVVDATGQRALIASQLGLKVTDPTLKKAALFTHYQGALRDSGDDEGATLVLHTENEEAWFWYIPLPEDRVSVGVVGSVDYLVRQREGGLERVFDEEIERCSPLLSRLSAGRRAMPVKAIKNFSYRSSRIAGDGWVLVGDAYGFIDPIYSSGVFLALASGELAADAIVSALENNDFSGSRLSSFGPRFFSGMEAMRRLVYAFYRPDFSFSRFLAHDPDKKSELIELLMGDVFDRDFTALFAAMDRVEEMFRPLAAQEP